ncbi:MAG: type IV secretion protein DotN [Alphaproteobacteria bacterium]|nr:type IV secretion protein DotN [Alphaproteobacteria bacterium]MBP7758746.1 type IV secretion protein DotN [Alphaproteobacteria bacterium]MBP7761774.1 type IV secretion protein DotN [Alphaproteobacteria bacterium]MBP7903717.1 type IV secretion protein DotN [Alphaproteobacteria bacterium]
MDRIPITLGLSKFTGRSKKKKEGAGDSGSSSARETVSKDLKQTIFERDGFSCRCCGFQSKKYQEVIQVNGNVADISEGNLATVCIFCHQCFNLDQVGVMKSGVLLWLPEIDQADLHHMARAIYVARISQGPIAEAARKALDGLMKRRDPIRKRIGTDDAYTLATVLKDYLSDHHYGIRAQKLEGVKLFPLDRRIIKEADLEFNQFPQILAYWRSKDGPFGGKPPQQWFSIYNSIHSS